MTRLRLVTVLAYLLLAGIGYALLARAVPLPVEEPGPPPALRFDQDRAYATVERIATQFPGRVTGTPADEAAARWMAGELRALGMEVVEQRFRAFGAFLPPGTDWRRREGVNVVGIHRGQIDDAILFGAHRDVHLDAGQGADDNASGTGTLLEIAGALAATPHRHTYVFISFGAEEIGLGGAGHFANHWPGMDRVRLLLNFDMMGWRHAAGTTLGHWEHLPLGATGLLQGMVERDRGAFFLAPSKTFWRIAGIVDDGGSDSGIFAMRGYPALLFVDGPPRPGAPRHCNHAPCDTMEQVSADALGRAGRFAEELVRRVDAGDHLNGPRRFLVRGDRYVPEAQVLGVGALAVLFALAQPALAIAGARAVAADPAGELRGQLPFWLGALAAAVLVPLALELSGFQAAPDWPRFLAWLGLAAAATGALFVLRLRSAAASPAAERLALSTGLAALYLAAAFLTNLLFAMIAGLPLLLLTSRVQLRRSWPWRLLDIALVLPGVLWSALWLALAVLAGFANYFPRLSVLGAIALAYLAAAVPTVFVPLRGRRGAASPIESA